MRAFPLAAALIVLAACQKADPPPPPAAPSAADLARNAALASFQLTPADGARIEFSLTGDESAAIARDKQTGICCVLYVAPDGAWREHTKLKGAATEAQLAAPLKSAGTMQETATRNDLEILAERMCK